MQAKYYCNIKNTAQESSIPQLVPIDRQIVNRNDSNPPCSILYLNLLYPCSPSCPDLPPVQVHRLNRHGYYCKEIENPKRSLSLIKESYKIYIEDKEDK